VGKDFPLSNENWQNTIAQSSMIQELDVKSDLILDMEKNNNKMKRR